MGKKSSGSSSQPAAPDYTALANQQYELGKKSLDDQTMANRANQINNQGSLTWAKDPTTGQWTQTVTTNPQNQAMIDALRGQQQNMLGQFQGGAVDTSGMAQWQNPNMGSMDTSGMSNWQGLNTSYADPSDFNNFANLGTSYADTSGLGQWGDASKLQQGVGFGNVQDVQKAMMGQLQPGLDTARQSEIQRLKAQGLTEGSEAWNTSMANLGRNENDAAQKALLSGMGAYGDIFNRQLSANQYSDALRGKQLGESMDLSNQQFNQNQAVANQQNALRQQQLNEQLGLTNQQFGQDQAQADQQNKLRQNQMSEMLGLRNQQLGEADFTNKLRQNQFNEGLTQRNLPMTDFSVLSQNIGGLQPSFGSYGQAGAAAPPNLTGAAQSQYDDLISRYNAGQQQSASRASGIGGLLGAGIGGYFGGDMNSAMFGSGLGSMFGGLFG